MKSTEDIIHNTLDYSHRLKAHMQNVRPIETRHNVAHNKNYHLDPALQTAKKILLRRINKTGFQDNYEGPFDVIARSDKYFTIRLDNGRIDNVTIDQLKPCFTQSEALPQPAEDHEVTVSTPIADGCAAPQFQYKSSTIQYNWLPHPVISPTLERGVMWLAPQRFMQT